MFYSIQTRTAFYTRNYTYFFVDNKHICYILNIYLCFYLLFDLPLYMYLFVFETPKKQTTSVVDCNTSSHTLIKKYDISYKFLF